MTWRSDAFARSVPIWRKNVVVLLAARSVGLACASAREYTLTVI
jgi:hypothetical protein